MQHPFVVGNRSHRNTDMLLGDLLRSSRPTTYSKHNYSHNQTRSITSSHNWIPKNFKDGDSPPSPAKQILPGCIKPLKNIIFQISYLTPKPKLVINMLTMWDSVKSLTKAFPAPPFPHPYCLLWWNGWPLNQVGWEGIVLNKSMLADPDYFFRLHMQGV